MNIIFQIDGGIGKSIAGTAVCRAIKTQYPNERLLSELGFREVEGAFEINVPEYEANTIYVKM